MSCVMGLKATMRGRERGRLLNSGGLLKGLWSRLQSSLFLLPVHHSGCTHTGAISCPLRHCLTLTPANRMHGATPSLKLLLIHACRHENIANTLQKRPLIVLGGYLRASYVVCVSSVALVTCFFACLDVAILKHTRAKHVVLGQGKSTLAQFAEVNVP